MTRPRDDPRFRVSDVLLLVAASAVAIRFASAVSRDFNSGAWDNRWTPARVVLDMRMRGPFTSPVHFLYWAEVVPAVLQVMMVALAVRGLIRARAVRRRTGALPGFSASLATAAAIPAVWAGYGLLMLPRAWGSTMIRDGIGEAWRFRTPIYQSYLISNVAIGVAIASAWATSALVGRWRPEPTWADRAGRSGAVLLVLLAPLNLWALMTAG